MSCDASVEHSVVHVWRAHVEDSLPPIHGHRVLQQLLGEIGEAPPLDGLVVSTRVQDAGPEVRGGALEVSGHLLQVVLRHCISEARGVEDLRSERGLQSILPQHGLAGVAPLPKSILPSSATHRRTVRAHWPRSTLQRPQNRACETRSLY